MTFTPGFENDIFISYSHYDNAAPRGEPGWVDQFHEELEIYLVKRFGHKKISIWRDKKLQGSTLFDTRIREQIRKSALFFALISPNYLKSEYCRKELEWFYDDAKKSEPGLSVNNECRIFPVLLKNIPHNSWPEQLMGVSGFPMHDQGEVSENPGEPLDHREVQYNKKLCKIVDALETNLKLFPIAVTDDKERNKEEEKQNEEEEREKQGKEQERLLKKKKRRLTILIAVVITIVLVLVAWLANLAINSGKEAEKINKVAVKIIEETVRNMQRVNNQNLESNYKLARLFDELAMNALEFGKNKEAWLYMTAALRQKIDSRKLHLGPVSAGALLTPRVVNEAFGEQWSLPTLNGHSEPVTSVAFSPDGKTIASASWDKTIRLWNSESKTVTAILRGHTDGVTCVAFSPDRRTIASGSIDKTIRLWDSESKTVTAILRGHTDGVACVAFSPDDKGKTIASGSYDNTFRLWDKDSGTEIAIFIEHSGPVSSLAFSPDGTTIVSGSWDSTVRLWDRKSQKEIIPFIKYSHPVRCVAFSPDGKTIASGSSDNTIRLWDRESKKEVASLKGHTEFAYSVAFSPDGKRIVSGSSDMTIRLWDRDSKKEIAILKGHTGSVTCVAFSPDGETIASGSYDKTIRLWDMRIFNLFLKGGKPTPLFFTFADGAEFFWGVRLEGIEYKTVERPVNFDEKFRPLLNEPAPGQSKFEQILQWAVNQEKKK